jgi:type II secretory pathway component PulL
LPPLSFNTVDAQLLSATAAALASAADDTNVSSSNRSEAALATATQVLAGAIESPVELRRGSLNWRGQRFALGRHVRALQLAAVALVLAVSLALFVRSRHSVALADQLASQETTVYQQLFPNKPVPSGIRSRLESALTQLKGVRGDASNLTKTAPVLPVLAPLLAALPTEMRFRILELRIEDGQLYLDGEAREHGDAVTIAALLRKSGFDVAAPRSQRLEGQKVSFRITGRFVGTEKAQGTST